MGGLSDGPSASRQARRDANDCRPPDPEPSCRGWLTVSLDQVANCNGDPRRRPDGSGAARCALVHAHDDAGRTCTAADPEPVATFGSRLLSALPTVTRTRSPARVARGAAAIRHLADTRFSLELDDGVSTQA